MLLQTIRTSWTRMMKSSFSDWAVRTTACGIISMMASGHTGKNSLPLHLVHGLVLAACMS
jgi:hypothetical protein